MNRLLAGGLVGLLLGQGAVLRAQEAQWRPATTRVTVTLKPAVAAGDPGPLPRAVLGRPVALQEATFGPPVREDQQVTPVSFSQAPVPSLPFTARSQNPDLPPPPPPAPVSGAPGGMDDRYNCGVVTEPPPPAAGAPILGGAGQFIGGLFKGPAGPEPAGGRKLFQSDHCFDNFISPVTNPYLFEDPRALTEVRPIFMYQLTPDKNYIFHGGDIEFYSLQARVALTERWSLVLNKLGYIAMQIDDGPQYPDSSGFAEVWLGPKFTFLRNDASKTVAAAGLTFQIPTGPNSVFQNTGTLSVVPYVSLAQSFCPCGWGSFNFLGTVGYSFSTNDERAEYVFTSLHVDMNVANLNKIYPLMELNWFHYTRDGHSRVLGFEGRDLANLGSTNVAGEDGLLTLALGARYKFSECVQTGIAAEFPLTGRRDLLDFRLTLDLIFRY